MTQIRPGLRKSPDAPFSGAVHLVVLGIEQRPRPADKSQAARHQTPPLPPRPDSSVLSDSIPLFFIGQNRDGLWVAREANGQMGGLFLLRSSALRFAKKNSHPAGCATMLLTQPLEFDVVNQGGLFATRLAAAVEAAARGTPTLGAFVGIVVVEWRKLVNQISRAVAGARRNRGTIERELFEGQYTVSSKSDDDLPVTR
jgi:hypothetical protein